MPRRRPPTDWFPPPSRPLPVDGGLRARSQRGAIGETWWSRRFLDLLDSFGMGGRIDRGRTYARKGQVISMEVHPGRVEAEVQGSRARPYRVRIGLAPLSEADWRRAEDAMVARAAFLARLLAGEMPEDIEQAFGDGAHGLFPDGPDQLDNDCSCPDWGDPCKHAAAVYYLLAEAFDEDPFLLLRWRGRDRDQLLGNLRALRGHAPVEEAAGGADGGGDWAMVEQVDTPALDDRVEDYWVIGSALASLRLDPTVPRPADAAVRALEPLDLAVGQRAVTAVLAPAYDTLTRGGHDRLLAAPPESDR